jgi:RNA polymerase sigma factor (sigma-70 family)
MSTAPYDRDHRIELISKAQAGDPGASAAFIALNRGLLERIVNTYRRFVAPHQIADLRSEAVKGLLDGIHAFDAGKTSGKPESYVFDWCRARAAKYAKLKGRASASIEETSLEDLPDGELERQGACAWDAHDIDFEGVEEAVTARLNPTERNVYRLRMVADEPLTLRELAESMGLKVEAVRRIEISARAKLRRAWEEL